jgi:hypothetical protein
VSGRSSPMAKTRRWRAGAAGHMDGGFALQPVTGPVARDGPGGSAGGARGRNLGPARRQPGLPPRFARDLGRQVAAGEPVTAQRSNPAQRAGRGWRRRPLVSRTHSHMHTCSWWAILTARITVRAASHRRRPARAIVSLAPFRTARSARAPLARTMSGSGGSGRSARATGVRSGPSAGRCGYGSSLTSLGSLIRQDEGRPYERAADVRICPGPLCRAGGCRPAMPGRLIRLSRSVRGRWRSRRAGLRSRSGNPSRGRSGTGPGSARNRSRTACRPGRTPAPSPCWIRPG